MESPEELLAWFEGIKQKQVNERAEFEEKIKKHNELLLKYRVEVYNKSPKLERLFQLERIITQYIDLLNRGKYEAGAFEVEIKANEQDTPMAYFLEWKRRLSDEVISQYTTLLNSVNTRSKQAIYYESSDKKPEEPKLSKDEKKLTEYKRGTYKTEKQSYQALYIQKAMDEIRDLIKRKKDIEWESVEKKIISQLLNRGVKEKTLKSWFPPMKKEIRLAEIQQKVLNDYPSQR